MITIPNENAEAWLSTLKKYQSSSVRTFLESGNEEKALELWLTASGPSSVSQFGGDNSKTPGRKAFVEQFKLEFKAFLCGGDKYTQEREGLGALTGDVKTYLVGVISSAIAVSLGSTAALIAPAVVIMLIAVSKMGVNAWCSLGPTTEC
ncbi:hypothetical protein NWT83_05930 [Klebsiella quasipneumoniae]|uniref:hypothetical protein n=1 Tax=Klebsiella quasipneumoniae TaxID=1463165 RepID=UPI001127E0B5|nr:hypothetical protein [Klebsiella quasipneumoniae]QER53210.1 hypothetical protein F2980_08700 [Klebsiella quasipneumoniae subsp. quasipneumoniae]TPB66650.1 hypothetical protein EC587_16225 [Klebsiella quasipneumoniae subsp. quasipneumoniae]UVG27073.1 hypothetical protein NWT83_05930 [Klebsiella quasipneumoniae]UVG32089.1 hypothetical protein NWT71_05930 [Klebsiella quasipneumoniae]